MSQLLDYLKLALMNIKANKVRTFLTMLGIIIGISSVITVISLGQGFAGEISSSLSDMAGGQIYIYSEDSDEGEAIEFTKEDCDFIKDKITGVDGVSPMYGYYATANSRKGSISAIIYGGTPDLNYNYKEPIIAGRFFDETDYELMNRVCVIPEKTAIDAFGSTDVLGMTIELAIRDIIDEYTIIGIRKDKEESSQVVDAVIGNDQLMIDIPLSTFFAEMVGEENAADYATFSSFYIYTDGLHDTTQITNQAIKLLAARYNCRGKDIIKNEDFNSIMDEVNTITGLITLFIVFIAGISLVVGGIGVMTIMLVSVTERTREIGIRKALGAKTGSILFQFLCESAIITLIAGLIGIIFGIIFAKLIGGIMNITVSVSLITILIASVFSSGVGIFFGIYPARKAAKLSPIEALRHD